MSECLSCKEYRQMDVFLSRPDVSFGKHDFPPEYGFAIYFDGLQFLGPSLYCAYRSAKEYEQNLHIIGPTRAAKLAVIGTKNIRSELRRRAGGEG